MKCPNCGFESHAGMRFCGQCGAPLGSPCPNCAFVNPLTYRFCGMCGLSLTEASAAASVAQLPLPLDAPAPPLLPGLHADETLPQVQHPGPPSMRTETPTPGLPAPGLTAPLAGERRIATIILADVCNSTDLMEHLGTETWVEMMNQVLQLLAAEVYRFGGHVDQFRGDGLVAFFGATHSHEDDPERAILAALAMHEALRPFAEEMLAKDISLKVRVGVNTGEVIVGSVGEAGQHREDTAMGEGVALAARMESSAEPGTVLVSAHTYHLVESRFEWQPLGEISVKGVSRPIAVYRPLRLRSLTEARQARDLSLPLVAGRDAPLEALRGCVTAVQQGRGGIAVVTGAKGMGKTQLINHVRRQFEQAAEPPAEPVAPEKPGPATPPVTWLLGHCQSYDQSTPYSLWLGLLHNWLEAADSDATAASPDMAGLLYQQSELLWGDDVERYYPYLAMLLSLPVEGPQARRITYLKAEGLQKQIFSTVYSWVEALAQRGPLVMTLTDLQFADTSSLELLQHCLPICESAPVLWLASFRPERTSPVWQFRHYVETEYPHRLTAIDLPPLTPSETRALIEQMLGRGTLADATTALLIEKAEGNPYYARELVYALIDQGLVQQDAAGVWRQMQPIQSVNLPGSLRGLLLTRIDHLSVEERHVLQIAAVIGPLFWRSVLEGLIRDPAQLKRALTNLQRAQLIHEQNVEPELGIAYAFTPSLVRDVVYESLLNAQRTAYHLQIGEQIEQIISPESISIYHGLLAYHYHQAGNYRRELYHALGAAAEMRRVYANSDALAHYTRVLELLEQIEARGADEDQLHSIREMRFEALEGRAQVLARMGHIEAGQADARALLPLARLLTDDPIFMLDALLSQPEVSDPNTPEELTTGLQMAQQALALAQQAGDKHREMHSLLAVGHLQQLHRDPAWHELRARALELSRQLGDLRTEVGLLLGIGGAYSMDNLERNAEYVQAALSISQRLEDRETEAWLLAALSPEHERRGDYYRQLTEFEQKRVQIYREVGNRLGEGHALVFAGQIQAIYLGDYEGGLAVLEEALDRWSESSDKIFALLRIAQIQGELGQFDAAWATIAQARTVTERVLFSLGHAGLRLVEAILHNAQGGPEHWQQALNLQAQVRQMVAEGQVSRQYQMVAACETAAAHLGLASVPDMAAPERDEHLRYALEASGNALDIYRQFGFTQITECTGEEIMYRHSLALAANGRHEEAQDMLKSAYREMMRKHGMIPADSPFRRTFLENIKLHRQIRAAYEAAFRNQP